MTIEAVEVRRLSLPLASPFATPWGTEVERTVVLVRVAGDGVEGWGECAALTAPLYTSEWADGAFRVLLDVLAPRLVGGPLVGSSVAGALAAVHGHPMAKAALEMAVLDAELRLAGESLASRLGSVRARVPAGIALGLPSSVPALLDEVAVALDEGYQRVKLKVSPASGVAHVRAVRERFPSLDLQVDANGTFSIEAAGALAELDDLGLVCIEQPLPPDDLAGSAVLAGRLRTPICLDEAITSAAATSAALDAGACSVVCVKAGHVGGLLEALRVRDVCVDRGASAFVGGMLETGVGRAALVALASVPGFDLVGDVSPSARWYPEDVTAPLPLVDGHLAVPAGPGLGVVPLPGPLASSTTDIEVVRP